jgi:protease I
VAHVGVLLRDGYQELEFWYPVLRLREGGADVTVIGVDGDRTYHSKLGYPVIPDLTLGDAPDRLDAIIVPGASAHHSLDPKTTAFLQRAHAQGSILAASSEGPRAFAEAGLLKGRAVAGSAAIAAAVEAAGGTSSDEEVVVDGTVITARSADSLPAFFRALDATLHQKV